MALFRYKGRTGRGEAVTGVLDAESPEALANRLFTSGVTPIEIAAAAPVSDPLGDLWHRVGGGRTKVTDLILFSRQMYTITKAGVPLLRGMRSLAASTGNAILRTALSGVVDSLQSGRDLGSSLARYPEVFSKFYVSIVRVGESSGTLPTAFLRMYEYLGMEKATTDKLKSALRYPIIVLGAIMVAIGIITTWVLPKFAPIFRSLGDNIPWPTLALMTSAEFVSEYWYLVAAAAVAVYTAGVLYLRNDQGRYRWDRFKLRIPVLGPVVQKATLARVCRSFAVALEAGVPIVQALNIISRATGNEYMTERLLALRNGIEHGESLSHAAQTGVLFTPLVLQMIAVGEETGALNEMLTEVADFYEREVDYDLENLSAALEPLLIVAVGGIVLILALGVFLPLWDMAANAGNAR
jgi:MSHA biogenesis protein MshG